MGYGRFGVREICDVVFRPLSSIDIGKQHFDKMQPCLYIDTATTSSLEGAATTVYAQGGKGNPRLIAWEGEKTLTFTIEDALLNTVSFAMLSGAGVVDADNADEKRIFMHTTYDLPVKGSNSGERYVELDEETRNGDIIFVSKEAPVYAVALNNVGGIKSYLSAIQLSEIRKGGDAIVNAGPITPSSGEVIKFIISKGTSNYADSEVKVGDVVRIDCYTVHTSGAQQLTIDAENFGGYYYIEASTLFRDEETGKDFPAEFVIPRGKIQSNFTFSMASTGDPTTFTFTIDAFPAFTSFNKSKKVLAVINIIDPKDDKGHYYADSSVLGHQGRTNDSAAETYFGGSMFDSGFNWTGVATQAAASE